jgi:5-methylthioadenosine/S-adenosylhomocysteine deaminase
MSGRFDLLIADTTAVLGGVRDEQYRVVPDVSIGIADRRIAWIGEGAGREGVTAETVVDARGMYAFPGLVNTHNHLFQNLIKGLGDELYLLPWVEMLILPTADEMTAEETYLGALVGCLEAIRSGTTTLLDFMFGLPDIELHRAVMRAFRDSGLRGFLGRAVRDLNPDSGHRDPWFMPLDDVFDQMRQVARDFPSGLAVPSVLPAPGTMRTMTLDGLLRVVDYAETEGTQITMHMGEYSDEREASIERWGVGTFHKAEEVGYLSPRVVAAHCVKLDREEIEIMARTGAHVSYNPVSNAYLGNGIAPVVEMLETGVSVALATDGGACGNTQDMIEALKFAAVMPKAREEDPRVFNARDALHLATAGGARAVGLPADLGAIEVGRLADLFLLDPYRLKTVPVHDPISALVFQSGQSNVDTVVIDGRLVLENGRFTQVDEDAVVREVQGRALALSRRVGTHWLAKGRRLTPFGHGVTIGGRGEWGADERPIGGTGDHVARGPAAAGSDGGADRGANGSPAAGEAAGAADEAAGATP